jgi:hypothetical protein
VSARGQRSARTERLRRERHFRRRRRDLLEDAGLAVLVTIALVSVTAGLGVLALIEVGLAAALTASMFTERAIKRRRGRDRRSSRRT